MKVKTVEKFCEGKFRDDRNEDRVFEGEHHVAVIDGSSAAQPINGRPGGIVAAETVVEVLQELEPEASIDVFEHTANVALARLATRHTVSSPYAAVVVLSLQRREIWRIGDCPFAVDGCWNIPPHNPHERRYISFRQMMASAYRNLSAGKFEEALSSLLHADVTRDWLASTKKWVNDEGDELFSFAAVDERPAPSRFKEVFLVPDSIRSIILASDGAVVSGHGQKGPPDVNAMLVSIDALKRDDPLCVSLFPYWRGFLDGSSFLDDTTFTELAVEC